MSPSLCRQSPLWKNQRVTPNSVTLCPVWLPEGHSFWRLGPQACTIEVSVPLQAPVPKHLFPHPCPPQPGCSPSPFPSPLHPSVLAPDFAPCFSRFISPPLPVPLRAARRGPHTPVSLGTAAKLQDLPQPFWFLAASPASGPNPAHTALEPQLPGARREKALLSSLTWTQ